MKALVALTLSALFLAGPSAQASAAATAPYDAKAAPLDDLSRELLTGNGYELRDDGRVWDKINEAAVPRDDMPYLLSRLASARRLKALLQINAVITRYDAERKLTPEDKEAVRDIARKNWVVFGVTPRHDFRAYFSSEEQEALDKIAPRFDTMAPMSMRDPEPLTAEPPVTAAPAAPPAVSVATSAPKVELGVLKPWTPPEPSTATVAAVQVSTPQVVAAPPPPEPVSAPPAPEPPKPAAIDAAQFDKFVAEGPYSKESRALLELIGKRAPQYCLPLLRRTVVLAVPQIIVDAGRTGAAVRAAFTVKAADALAPPVVALSPGPVFIEVKKGLFKAKSAVLLPESAEAWKELGVARPTLQAFAADAAGAAVENGDWGAVRTYPDASRRGTYSDLEQAGELLEQLLLLGLQREGYVQSPYAAWRWARTARLLFSARLKQEMKRDNFLDPDRRAELRDWLDSPEESEDAVAASWAAARLGRLDPRLGPPDVAREAEASRRASCARTALEDALVEAARRRAVRVGTLEALLDAGVIDAPSAKAAAQSAADHENAAKKALLAAPPACPAPDAALDAGLRRAGLLTAEAARAERAMRENSARGESRGL
jgi:hypothetical protein